MNHYYFSQSKNHYLAIRLNGIEYSVPADYERVLSTRDLRERAKHGGIPSYLPRISQDQTTGYKNLFLSKL